MLFLKQIYPSFPTVIPGIFPIELVEVIMGYDLYEMYKRGISRKEGCIGLVIFFCGNILRTLLQGGLSVKYGNQGYLLCWNTFPSIIVGAGLTIFILSLNIRKMNGLIIYVGAKTYVMFMVHWVVLWFYKSELVFSKFSAIACVDRNTWVSTMLYVILCVLYLFVTSFTIAVLFSGIKRMGLEGVKQVWRFCKKYFVISK